MLSRDGETGGDEYAAELAPTGIAHDEFREAVDRLSNELDAVEDALPARQTDLARHVAESNRDGVTRLRSRVDQFAGHVVDGEAVFDDCVTYTDLAATKRQSTDEISGLGGSLDDRINETYAPAQAHWNGMPPDEEPGEPTVNIVPAPRSFSYVQTASGTAIASSTHGRTPAWLSLPTDCNGPSRPS